MAENENETDELLNQVLAELKTINERNKKVLNLHNVEMVSMEKEEITF